MRATICSLLVVLVGMGSWVAAAEPLTVREAKALLAMPKGSVSLGRTNDGALHEAVELPPRGAGYQVLSHAVGRKTNYGTRELIDVIARATGVVAEKFPGSKLGVGNLGFEDGTKIPWSVSHQSGRDADLGMYAVDGEGRALEMLPFLQYGPDGTASHKGEVVHFDVARNTALVTALVEDPTARVQYIFVAAWLKAKVVAEARRTGASPMIVQRLEEVLHQPTDSNPHADHYHVRLFCSIEDRLHGCINRQPPRSWVDLGDAEHAARSLALARIFEIAGNDALHVAALDKLAAIQGTAAMDAVVGELEHRSTKVRKAALATLVAWGDPGAAERIMALLPRVRDAKWAAELFSAVPELDAESLVPLAVKVASAPESMLHPDVQKKAGVSLQVSALKILERHGGAAEVPMLIGLAGAKNKAVKGAARGALAWVTCQPAATRFDVWWAEHAREDVVTWVRAGLVARKKKVPASLRTRAGVEVLIPLVAAGDGALRHCAGRALVDITGHPFDPRLRSPARNRKHWTSWWRDNQQTSSLP